MGLSKEISDEQEKSEESRKEKVEPQEKSEELEEKKSEEVRKFHPMWSAQGEKKGKEYLMKQREELRKSGSSTKEMMTKENIEKWLNEGESYVGIGRKVGLTGSTVKKYVDKYGLEKQEKLVEEKVVEETKEIVGEAKKYLTREEEKEKRDEHLRKVAEKRKEILGKNQKPESLLTKENLTKWLGDNWTYWRIAEETGANDVDVSRISKNFGLSRKPSNTVYIPRN